MSLFDIFRRKHSKSTTRRMPDHYYDELWKKDRNLFWAQVKKEWHDLNPGKVTTCDGISFEKRCEYLEWMLGVASKWSIAEMRQNLIAAKKDQAETMCVFDVIDRTDYYFPLIII